MNVYETPLNSRYASREMQEIFSPSKKFKRWRELWIILAESQKELGLSITDEQIEELKKYKDTINYDVAREREKIVRHDVMAHVYAYGEQCPNAKPIIHLGATSCYVVDNTDITIMKEAMEIIKTKVLSAISNLVDFADKYKAMPTLGYTHLQPAQLTTVGKRATLWIQDLMQDLEEIDFVLKNLKLLGSKGTTGTQASFMELFNNDSEKVKKLDKLIAEKLGYKDVYSVSGQTYTRKIDSRFVNVLSSIAQSCYKFSNDIRFLQSVRELEEPFEKEQIGSSAMAYKRNPMRCERIAGLCRYIISTSQNTAFTASSQWLERTLDDSSNKRIVIPEAFLATDAVLNILINVSSGIVVNSKIIEKRVSEELVFMATENILMDSVKKGGDRQELHERIRKHSMEVSYNIKLGKENDLVYRIANDCLFNMTAEEIETTLNPKNYVGRAPEQTEEYLKDNVQPIIKKYKENIILKMELSI